jgi:rubrerythrin
LAQSEYHAMAVLSEDPEIRGIFEQFQGEETKHEQGLIWLYGKFKARFVVE